MGIDHGEGFLLTETDLVSDATLASAPATLEVVK